MTLVLSITHIPIALLNCISNQPSYRILGRSRKLWRLKVDAVPTLVGPEQEVEEFTFKEPDEVEIEMM